MPFLVTYNVPNPPAPPSAPQSQPQLANGAVAPTGRDVETRPSTQQPPQPVAETAPAPGTMVANAINGIIPEMAILVNARFALNRSTFASIRNIISFVFMASAWIGAFLGFKSSTGFTMPGVPAISSGARAMGFEGIARLLERMKEKSIMPTGIGGLPGNITSPSIGTACGHHEVTTPTPNVDAIEKIMLGLTQLYDLENKRLRSIIEALAHENNQASQKLESIQEELTDTQRQLNDSRFREFVSENRWESERKSWEAERMELKAQIRTERTMREDQRRIDFYILALLLGFVLVLYILRAWARRYRRQLRQVQFVKE